MGTPANVITLMQGTTNMTSNIEVTKALERGPMNSETRRRTALFKLAIDRDQLRAALVEAERFMAYFAGETDTFVGPGTPKTCLAEIRAALGHVEAPSQDRRTREAYSEGSGETVGPARIEELEGACRAYIGEINRLKTLLSRPAMPEVRLPLTHPEEEVLTFFRDFTAKNGRPPAARVAAISLRRSHTTILHTLSRLIWKHYIIKQQPDERARRNTHFWPKEHFPCG